MKYIRFIIIFGVTLLILLIMLFIDNKYLGIYTDNITIYYDNEENDEYSWYYTLNNNILKFNYANEKELDDNLFRKEWNFSIVKDGKTQLIFEYKKDKSSDYKYKIVYNFNVKNNKIYWEYGEGFGLISYPNPY